MNFLYPSFLWALTALSIPIIIHLFNFRKTTRVYFSNNRFLKQVKESTTAKRKLKHYLILASRLLFLFFLIIAFAQPIIPARENLSNTRNIVIYLDNSFSMSTQWEGKTRSFDAAIAFAKDIVNLFPPDTRYRLVTNDFAPFSNTFKSQAEVVDLLSQVRMSPVSRSLEEINERIRLGSLQRGQDIFLISDFQKSTFGAPSLLPGDSSIHRHLIPLTSELKNNIFIDTAYLENPFAIGQEKNSLTVKVRNDGRKEVNQLILKLIINNIQAATASVNIPPKGSSEVNFDLITRLSGLNKARISFTDYPVNFDNEFYFTLNFTDKIRIVEVKNITGATPVERVYGNNMIFDYKGFSVNNFNYSLLNNADIVVLNGVNLIDASLALALRNYLDASGTVLFLPGDKPDVTSYRNFLMLPSLSVTAAQHQDLERPDFDNPFFENVFEERSTSLVMPKAQKILDWGADRSSLLRFKNGQPFLSLFQQNGKLYVLSTPLASDFTDFYNHALFVPVMYRIAASAKKNILKPYYTLKENFITLQLDSLTGEEPLRLVGAQEIVPPQRTVNDKVLMDIPKFSMTQGFYNVVMNRDTTDVLAFNLDKNESMMDQYTGAEVKNLLGGADNISIFEAGSSAAFSNEIKARYLGKPLWKYAVMLALLFLLIEILLIRFLK